MKVMILVPSFGKSSPIEGAFLFARYLHERGVEVVFVSLDDNYKSKENIIGEITKVGIGSVCLNIKGWRGILRYRSRIQNYCKEKGVDVILAYLLRPTLIASLLSNNIVKIVFIRGMLRENYNISYGKIISNIFASLEMKALQKMDHVFSMSEQMSQWLKSEGIDSHRISNVNNFVDVRSIRSLVTHEESRDKIKIKIGMFCNIVPLKKIDVALRAISKVINSYKHYNVVFNLVGDGPLRKQMEKLAYRLNLNNKVVFHGFLSNPWQLMNEMNLVVLTSEAEGVPRCLMEALSLGKTVLASDIPGVNELILDGQTGFLFPVGDVDELAFLIDRVIQNESYLPSERLVNFMLKNYDIHICCEKMLNQINKAYHEKKKNISSL